MEEKYGIHFREELLTAPWVWPYDEGGHGHSPVCAGYERPGGPRRRLLYGEAAQAIRALHRPDTDRLPIVALTANAFDEDVLRSRKAGMNAHLSKPLDIRKLVKTLRGLM